MIHKTYELVSHLPIQVSLQRIEDLLAMDGVRYKASNSSVISTQTPIVLLGIDPRLYTHNNWIGLNPFAFISGIEVRCESGDHGFTRVVVRINRLRALVWVAFWIMCSSLVASAMPLPGGTIVLVGIPFAAWLSTVSFLGGYLIKKEISDHLKDGNYPQAKT